MDNVRKLTHVVSVMTDQHKEICAVVRDEKDDHPLPHQIRRPRLTGSKKKPQTHQATEMKALQTRSEIPCRYKDCENPSCKILHPPVCQNYKSETGCKFVRTRSFRHVGAEEKPSKKSKKGGVKGPVAILKESTQLGCVSQDSHPRRSILREEGKLGSKRAVKFSKRTWHQKKSRKKRSIARKYPKV